MLFQNFRLAAEGQGEYCPLKNEIRIRKGGKVFRFVCEEDEILFTAPDRPEIAIPIALDATASELRRGMSLWMDYHETHGEKS
jgi:hypothetical protein